MMRFYWPLKAVAPWFQEITFKGESNGAIPAVRHSGFGVIFKKAGVFHVWPLLGGCIRIDGAGMRVKIDGQGKGVVFHTAQELVHHSKP